MNNSSIEWTDATWNPVTGCTKVSAGCKHCYAERVFVRAYSKQWYPGSTPEDGRPRRFTDIFLHNDRLEQPLHMRQPKRIFVNSMSDLFHEQVPYEFIDRVFSTMAKARQHTFQVLTKRPERLRDFLLSDHNPAVIALPNIWLGVSVEDQKTADERIPLLLQTPAAVRFLSVEPLLGLVNLQAVSMPDGDMLGNALFNFGADTGVDWVIVGGESGPGARPMHPDWVRSIRDQCVTAGVPFFFKQWGEWLPWVGSKLGDLPLDQPDRHAVVMPDGTVHKDFLPGGEVMSRVGKKAAGRRLDGRTWEEMPK